MTKAWLLFWLLLSYTVCLGPGPCYWQDRLAPPQQPAAAAGAAAAPAAAPAAAAVKPVAAPAAPVAARPALKCAPAGAVLPRVVDSIFEKDRHVKEVMVHFALMCGVAFCFCRSFFAKTRAVVSIFCSLGFVLLIAFSIEGLQELVPDYFHRGFAWSDIGFSLAGGTLGALAATLVSRLRVFTTRCR